MGLSLWRDGSDYLENSYLAYELEPVKDPEADWRLDTYIGTSRLPVLINDYLGARSDVVDEYHRDGIAAGFLCYPLAGLRRGAEQKYPGFPGRAARSNFEPSRSGSSDLPGRGRRPVSRVSGLSGLGSARGFGMQRRHSLKKAACPMPTSTHSGGMWAVCRCWTRKNRSLIFMRNRLSALGRGHCNAGIL